MAVIGPSPAEPGDILGRQEVGVCRPAEYDSSSVDVLAGRKGGAHGRLIVCNFPRSCDRRSAADGCNVGLPRAVVDSMHDSVWSACRLGPISPLSFPDNRRM
ncbi:tubulin beta chain [Aspergillus luchuensis]|uniref:Tubulin beta chain n=1 Tax=Aspergillus kawachii TaxID=1069201 RepID=A0A146EXZ2_ASPKA|nr:tubulin beta chain [Aspergillus luchuensis]